MNTRVIVCVACLFSLAVPGFAQQPTPQPAAKKHSIGLDVKNVASGGRASTTDSRPLHSVGGTHVTQKTESAPLFSVDVRNYSQTADNVTVEWYVFAKSGFGRTAPFLHDSGKITLPVEAGKTTTTTFEPKPMQIETTRTTTYTSRSSDSVGYTSHSERGSKICGWAVRVVADDQIVAVKASDLSYEKAAKNPPAKASTPGTRRP